MWPRWRSERVAVIARHATVVARPGGEVLRAPGTSFASADDALAALRTLPVPRPARFASRSVGLWLDDGFARLFGATWPDGIDDLATFRAYVAARFEQRFELPADEWTIVSPGAWPGRPVLCVAAPTALVEAVREAVAVHGLRASRITPLSLAEVGASISTRPRSPTLFVSSAGATRSVFLLLGGRVADCAVLPDTPRIETLAEAVFRDRGLLTSDVRRVLRVQAERAAATEALLAQRPLPLQLLQPEAAVGPAPVSAAGLAS